MHPASIRPRPALPGSWHLPSLHARTTACPGCSEMVCGICGRRTSSTSPKICPSPSANSNGWCSSRRSPTRSLPTRSSTPTATPNFEAPPVARSPRGCRTTGSGSGNSTPGIPRRRTSPSPKRYWKPRIPPCSQGSIPTRRGSKPSRSESLRGSNEPAARSRF